MQYFAICKLKNGEYECVNIRRYSLVAKGDTGRLDYKATIDKVISQLEKDNETRKEHYKIVEFVDFVEHGNGFGPSNHFKWAKECCEDAKKATYFIYDFENPENGVEYY